MRRTASRDKAAQREVEVGPPPLREAAVNPQREQDRVGGSSAIGHFDNDLVNFGRPSVDGACMRSDIVFRGRKWMVLDFGEAIPICDNDAI